MDGTTQYSCLPLPGLHQHLASCGVPQAYEKWPAGGVGAGGGGADPWDEVEQQCAMDPALAELRQHLVRHRITFVVFDMDLTVTARHTRGHLARDPDTMALYLESARATDALKVRERKEDEMRLPSTATGRAYNVHICLCLGIIRCLLCIQYNRCDICRELLHIIDKALRRRERAASHAGTHHI